MEEKVCRDCSAAKPMSEFHKNKNKKDGLNDICKSCNIARVQKNYQKREGVAGSKIDPVAKACKICLIIKEPIEYKKRKASPDGLCYNCSDCDKDRRKKLYESDPKAHYETTKRYKQDNLEKVREMEKRWREENKESKSSADKAWRDANKDRCRENAKAWNAANPDTVKAIRKRFRARVALDPVRYTRALLRNSVAQGLKRGIGFQYGSSQEILGCTFEEAWDHLKITWEMRYGRELTSEDKFHIDHCIPLSWALTKEDVMTLSKIENLQLLKVYDNLTKKDKWSNAPYPERLVKSNS